MNKVLNTDPYGKSMCQWFQKKFPKIIIPTGNDLVDILSGLIYSTKENRYGSIPAVESQVIVRNVIREAMDSYEPIPVLIPWGGRKAGSKDSIDLAEVSAVLQIVELNTAIRQFYEPGLLINIALEDIGARWMWRHEDNISEVVNKYTADMVQLVYILADGAGIMAIPESDKMGLKAYIEKSERYNSLLANVLKDKWTTPEIDNRDIPEFSILQDLGWKGELDFSQIEYYMSRYKALYPQNSIEDNLNMLSDYFAGAKARYDLDGKCAPDNLRTGRYIKISFTPEVPGMATLHSNTAYWRTIPLSQARTHIAPWRSKGYFQIKDGGNSVKSKICSPNDPKIAELIPSTTTIRSSNGTHILHIDTPYLLGD